MSMLEKQFDELNALYVDYISKPDHNDSDKVDFINSAFNKLNVMNKLVTMAANGVSIEDQVSIKQVATKEAEKIASKNAAAMMGGFDEDEEQQKQEDNVETERVISETEKLVESLKSQLEATGKQDLTVEQLNAMQQAKEQKAQETEDMIEQYANCDVEQIIVEEFLSWRVKPTYAGCRNILKLGEAYEKSGKTINTKSPIEDIQYYLTEVCGISRHQLHKNINLVISKADFSKSKFITILRKIPKDKITDEIILKEFLEFYVDE